MRLISGYLNLKFQDVYMQKECLITDEAICTFQSRIFLQVYMKAKLHEYGYENI
jgi:hypothetical protein